MCPPWGGRCTVRCPDVGSLHGRLCRLPARLDLQLSHHDLFVSRGRFPLESASPASCGVCVAWPWRAPVLNAQRASHRQPAAGPACRSAPCPAPRPGIGSSIRAHLKRRRKDRPAPRPLVGLLSALRSLRACPLLSSSVT